MSKRNERDRAASPAIYLVAAILAAIAGFGTVYVSFAPSDNGRPGGPEESGPAAGGPETNGGAPAGPLAGLNKGAMAPLLVRPKPLDLPAVHLRRRRRQVQVLGRFPRQNRASQHLGDLVRPLPRGDAGTRCARDQARRQGLRRGGGQYRQGRAREGCRLPEGDRRHASDALHRSFRQAVLNPEGGRHADDASHRSRRQGDRPPDRPGGLGLP